MIFSSTPLKDSCRSPRVAVALLALLIVLDQLSKIAMVNSGFPVEHNFGILFSLPVPAPLSLLLTVLVLGLGAWLGVKDGLWNNLMLRLGMILIAAGGLGNAVDRVRLGYVIDFIDLGAWPTFNLADVWICLGVAVVFWANFSSCEQSHGKHVSVVSRIESFPKEPSPLPPSADLIAEIKKGRRY